MRRHPVLTTALATAVLLLVFLVPAAWAQGPGNKPCENSGGPNGVAGGNAPKNPNCYPVAAPGGGTQYNFTPCKDGTAPPCAKNKSYSEPFGTAIPTGVAFASLGALVLGYLGWQRRQTLRLNT